MAQEIEIDDKGIVLFETNAVEKYVISEPRD